MAIYLSTNVLEMNLTNLFLECIFTKYASYNAVVGTVPLPVFIIVGK